MALKETRDYIRALDKASSHLSRAEDIVRDSSKFNKLRRINSMIIKLMDVKILD
jgi:hypothetical protein